MKKEIFLDGQKIVYFEEGEGIPFLIIHGWGGSSSPLDNSKLQEFLAENGFRVFIIALPGFGGSSLPKIKGDYDGITEGVFKFADKIILENFFLYGHCLGGLIALKLAKFYQKKIKGLILYGVPSPYLVRMSNKLGYFGFALLVFLTELSHIFFLPMPFLKKIKIWLHAQFRFYAKGRGIMWKVWKGITSKDFKENFYNLEKIKIPTLIIQGAKENIIARKGTQFLKRIPGSLIKIIPDVGHSIQIDAPEKLAEEIVNFTKTIKG